MQCTMQALPVVQWCNGEMAKYPSGRLADKDGKAPSWSPAGCNSGKWRVEAHRQSSISSRLFNNTIKVHGLEDGEEENVEGAEPDERLGGVVEAAEQPDERSSDHRQVHIHAL